MAGDVLQHGFGFPERLQVRIAQHRHAPVLQESRARLVPAPVFRLVVLAAVQFHGEPAFGAVEVQDPGRDDVLAADVARAFADLARARKTTGAVLTVDGGNIAAAMR